MATTDLLDAKLIYLLGRNARLSHTALAKALHCSREVIAFRLKRLMREGIIQGGTANVNFYRLGMNYFQILLRIRGGTTARLDELRDALIANPLITSVQRVFGSWDYLGMARARTIHELAILLDLLTTRFPEIVETRHFFVLREEGPGWAMLIPEQQALPRVPFDPGAFTRQFDQRNVQQHAAVDATDEMLLVGLGKDARRGILQLAADAGIVYRTALTRILRMISAGIIESFDGRGSIAKLGYSQRTVLLRLGNIAKNEQRAQEFFRSLRVCSRYWRLLGQVQFRINLYTKTTAEFERTMDRIRAFFGNDLLDIESMDILGQEKRSGFPSPLTVVHQG